MTAMYGKGAGRGRNEAMSQMCHLSSDRDRGSMATKIRVPPPFVFGGLLNNKGCTVRCKLFYTLAGDAAALYRSVVPPPLGRVRGCV